jgi:hypothetical protein
VTGLHYSTDYEVLYTAFTDLTCAKEKYKKAKIEEVADLLLQWHSPENVIFESFIMKGRLSPQPILTPGVGIELYEIFSFSS